MGLYTVVQYCQIQFCILHLTCSKKWQQPAEYETAAEKTLMGLVFTRRPCSKWLPGHVNPRHAQLLADLLLRWIAYEGSMLMTGSPTAGRFFYGTRFSPNNQDGKSDNGYCRPSR